MVSIQKMKPFKHIIVIIKELTIEKAFDERLKADH